MQNAIPPQAYDAIKEIMNIGAAHSATALSSLVGKRVNISLPEITFDTIEKVPPFFGHTENIESLVVLQFNGDAPGVFVLALPEHSSNILTEHIKKNGHGSPLSEVGNILAGQYLRVLAKFLKISIPHTMPSEATDMIGALISSILLEFGVQTDSILAGYVGIDIPELQVEGRLYLMFTPDSTQTLIATANQLIADTNE